MMSRSEACCLSGGSAEHPCRARITMIHNNTDFMICELWQKRFDEQIFAPGTGRVARIAQALGASINGCFHCRTSCGIGWHTISPDGGCPEHFRSHRLWRVAAPSAGIARTGAVPVWRCDLRAALQFGLGFERSFPHGGTRRCLLSGRMDIPNFTNCHGQRMKTSCK